MQLTLVHASGKPIDKNSDFTTNNSQATASGYDSQDAIGKQDRIYLDGITKKLQARSALVYVRQQ